MITNAKNGISSPEIHRSIGVTQKTAWFMLQRIRLAMKEGSFTKVNGRVEVDETFICGKARSMHKWIREQKITGTGGKDKTMVVGVLQRGGKVRTKVVTSRTKATLHKLVKANIQPGAEIFTDALKSYEGLNPEFVHQVVDHAIEHVKGHVHTNGLENFWSLLKRTLNGTYISDEPYHLFRYLDEQAFRCNERRHAKGDGGRFRLVIKNIHGRRLTYRGLTGKLSVTDAD